METIHIALAADDNYARYAGAVIVSILKSAAANDEIAVHLLNSGIQQKNIELLASLEKYHRPGRILFHAVDAEKIFPEVPLPSYISRSSMVRLALPQLLPELDRILYLDCDVIVMDSLSSLWNMELPAEAVAAGVLDFNTGLSKYAARFDLSAEEYVNAGVLILELEKMRKIRSQELFPPVWEKYGKFIQQGDQDLLNAAFRGKIARLPLRWNLMGGFFKHPLSGAMRERVREALCKPGIIHYTSQRKPWSLKASRHPLWEEYFKAVSGTELARPFFYFLKKYLFPKCRAVVPGAERG